MSTWAEFKAAVEAKGVKGDDEILYIDCATLDDLFVEFNEDLGGWSIW